MVHPDSSSIDEIALRLRDESIELQFDEEELHSRLITFESTLQYEDSVDRPTLEIVSDATIAVNGVQISLSRTKRFILNSLRLSQGFSLTGPEMRESGYEGTVDTFSNGITQLIASLEVVSNEPVIVRDTASKANARAYTLLPEVRIIDRREDEQGLTEKQRFLRAAVAHDEQGLPVVIDGKIAFTTTRYRINTTARMIREFKTSSHADSRLLDILGDSVNFYKASNRGAFQPITQTEHLLRDEEDALVAKKERGLIAYVTHQGDEEYDNEAITAIHEGVRSCFELFGRTLSIARACAKKYSKPYIPFQEIYQECSERLMEMALQQEYDPTSPDFRIKAAINLQRWVTKSVIPNEILPPVSRSRDSNKNAYELRAVVESMRQENGGVTPNIEAICQHTSMNREYVLGLLSLGSSAVSLDSPAYNDSQNDPSGESYIARVLHEDDFVDKELERMEVEEAMDMLFTSAGLTDDEKIVLSLHYELFHPSLCGAEISPSGREVTFTYPYTSEDFFARVGRGMRLDILSNDLFGKNRGYASNIHKVALRKARALLSDHPNLEAFGKRTGLESIVSEEDEKLRLIEKAHNISPEAPLDYDTLNELSKKNTFPGYRTIVRLFGSLPAFHQACGFEGDRKRIIRAMTNEEIVTMALKLQPDAPLRKGAIEQLSKEGKFVNRVTITRRFGSMAAFHQACGFET